MEIQLQPPFNSKWRKGYLRYNPDMDRNYVDLYNTHIDRTTVPYARYLMGVYLGYEVPEELEVDHKNNIRTDDRIENLQLLTQEENRLKQEWWISAMVVQWTIMPCSYCGGLLYITQRELNFRTNENICCSVSCARKYSFNISGVSRNNPNPEILLTEEQLNDIRQYKESNTSIRQTSKSLNISRHLVNKYWNSL